MRLVFCFAFVLSGAGPDVGLNRKCLNKGLFFVLVPVWDLKGAYFFVVVLGIRFKKSVLSLAL